MKVTIVGIDLAKTVFQLQGNDAKGRKLIKEKLRRHQLEGFMKGLEPCVVAMEACSGAHFWGRKFRALGFEVRLLPTQFVKPFVKGNKNDASDAEAICEAAVRPNMSFVPLKEEWHLDLQAVHRVRERLVGNRTALANEIRAILCEAGIVFDKGINNVSKFIPPLLDDDDQKLTSMMKGTIADLYAEFIDIDERVAHHQKRILSFAKANEACKNLETVRGVGPLTATAIVAAAPHPRHFRNGRHFAAWLGLVPRHSGSGGKNVILGISKRGDKYIRKLLVHGARAVLRELKEKDDRLSRWLSSLKERRGYNRAAVALANKNARIIWALLVSGERYNPVF